MKRTHQPVTFGARLRELREAAQMSQVELADKANFHPVEICRWEHGDRYPTLRQAQELASAIGGKTLTECWECVQVWPDRPARKPRRK